MPLRFHAWIFYRLSNCKSNPQLIVLLHDERSRFQRRGLFKGTLVGTKEIDTEEFTVNQTSDSRSMSLEVDAEEEKCPFQDDELKKAPDDHC